MAFDINMNKLVGRSLTRIRNMSNLQESGKKKHIRMVKLAYCSHGFMILNLNPVMSQIWVFGIFVEAFRRPLATMMSGDPKDIPGSQRDRLLPILQSL